MQNFRSTWNDHTTGLVDVTKPVCAEHMLISSFIPFAVITYGQIKGDHRQIRSCPLVHIAGCSEATSVDLGDLGNAV